MNELKNDSYPIVSLYMLLLYINGKLYSPLSKNA